MCIGISYLTKSILGGFGTFHVFSESLRKQVCGHRDTTEFSTLLISECIQGEHFHVLVLREEQKWNISFIINKKKPKVCSGISTMRACCRHPNQLNALSLRSGNLILHLDSDTRFFITFLLTHPLETCIIYSF